MNEVEELLDSETKDLDFNPGQCLLACPFVNYFYLTSSFVLGINMYVLVISEDVG